MEISFDTLLNVASLLVGGGGGAFFTWRFVRRKAKAEAMQAEAEVAKTDVEIEKERQDYYQQLAKDLAEDREYQKQKAAELQQDADRYKQERNELRERIEKMDESLRTMRTTYSEQKIETDRKIAQLGRKVASMVPLLCAVVGCPHRQRVTTWDGEDNKGDKSGPEITL